MISRIVLAVIVAIVVGLVCILLGGILGTLHIDILSSVGGFLEKYGWALGVLAGLWYFFAGGNLFPGTRA